MNPQVIVEWSLAVGVALLGLGVGVALLGVGVYLAISLIKEILPKSPPKGRIKPREGYMTLGQYMLLHGYQNGASFQYRDHDLKFDRYDPEFIEKTLFPNGEPAPTPNLEGYSEKSRFFWEKDFK